MAFGQPADVQSVFNSYFSIWHYSILMKHTVWQICTSKSQSKQVSIVEQSTWRGSHEKFSLKTACLAEHERKIHCILIASPHVIVFALCFCIFANSLLRMNNISSCVEDCSAALELQPSYSKALHRWRKAISHVVIWKSWKFWMLRYANHIGGDMK